MDIPELFVYGWSESSEFYLRLLTSSSIDNNVQGDTSTRYCSSWLVNVGKGRVKIDLVARLFDWTSGN